MGNIGGKWYPLGKRIAAVALVFVFMFTAMPNMSMTADSMGQEATLEEVLPPDEASTGREDSGGGDPDGEDSVPDRAPGEEEDESSSGAADGENDVSSAGGDASGVDSSTGSSGEESEPSSSETGSSSSSSGLEEEAPLLSPAAAPIIDLQGYTVVNSWDAFKTAVQAGGSEVKVRLGANLAASSDVTISGGANVLIDGSNESGSRYRLDMGNYRFLLSGSKDLIVSNLEITQNHSGSANNSLYGVFQMAASGAKWNAYFVDLAFNGSALVGSNQTDGSSSDRHFENVEFSGTTDITVGSQYRGFNGVVFARNISIAGNFSMLCPNPGATTGANSSTYQSFFKSPGTGDQASSQATSTTVSYGSFVVEPGANVVMDRFENRGTDDATSAYHRSLIIGYENYVFGANSSFTAAASTNRSGNDALATRSAIIKSANAKLFQVDEGATVRLETKGFNYANTGSYGYTALSLRKGSNLDIVVNGSLDIYARGNGAGYRSAAPVVLWGSGTSTTRVGLSGNLHVKSENGNAWYYKYSTSSVGKQTFIVDGGRVELNANNGGSRGAREYAAFEAYGKYDVDMQVLNGGQMHIQGNGYRGISLASSSGYNNKSILVDGAGSVLDVYGTAWAIAAETQPTLSISATNGGKINLKTGNEPGFGSYTGVYSYSGEAPSTVYSVGPTTYNVKGSGSEINIHHWGGTYSAIFHDGYGALIIDITDGGQMLVENDNSGTDKSARRAAITAQSTYLGRGSANNNYIHVSDPGSTLTVTNTNDTTHSGNGGDTGLYPSGAISFNSSAGGKILVENGANFYATSHSKAPTIHTYGGGISFINPGEFEIRNNAISTSIGSNTNAYANYGQAVFNERFRDANVNTSGNYPTAFSVKNADVTVWSHYENANGYAESDIDNKWLMATFDAKNSVKTTTPTSGIGGDHTRTQVDVEIGSARNQYVTGILAANEFYLSQYGRINGQGVGSTKTVSDTSAAGKDGALVRVGDVITYDITYLNNRDASATLNASDTLDAGLDFVSASDGGTYDAASRTITWGAINVAGGSSGTLTVTARVNAKAGLEVTNAARLQWTASGTTTTENPSVTNPVGSSKYMVTDEGTGSTNLRVGDVFSYEIRYVNRTGATSNLTVTDTLPQGVEFISADNGGVHDSGVVTWTVPNVPDLGTGTVSVKLRLTANFPGGTLKNTASLQWNNTTEPPETTDPVYSGKLVAEGSPGAGGAAVRVGDRITYEIIYINNTGAAATAVITDVLPTSLTFISATGPNGEDVSDAFDARENAITWTISDIADGAKGMVTLTVEVNDRAADPVRNVANIRWTSNGGQDYEENPDVTNPLIQTGSTKTIDDESLAGKNGETVQVGDLLTYRISYLNQQSGPVDVTITDKLDAGLTFVSATDHTGADAGSGVYDAAEHQVVWTISDAPVGEPGFVTLTVRVNEKAGTSISNKAVVQYGDYTEEPEIKVPVESSKTLAEGSKGAQTAPVRSGDYVDFVIHYANNTGYDANLTITDALPLGLNFVSATNPDGTPAENAHNSSSRTVTWNVGQVADKASGYVTLRVVATSDISAAQAESVRNTANLQWNIGLGAPEIESPYADVYYQVEGSKKTVASGSPGYNGAPVQLGDEITYEISYKNQRTKAATVTITDVLDEGLDFVAAYDPSGNPADVYDNASRTATWVLTGVQPAETGAVKLVVRVNGNAGPVVRNVASVKYDDGDGEPDTENPGVENPRVGSKVISNIEGRGTGDPAEYAGVTLNVGDVVTYRVDYVNRTGEAVLVYIDDQLHKDLAFQKLSVHGGANGSSVEYDRDEAIAKNWFNVGTNAVSWVGLAPADAAGYIEITVEIKDSFTDTQVYNQAKIRYVKDNSDLDGEDPDVTNPFGRRSRKYVSADSAAGVNGAPVKIGDEITYEISYTNDTDAPLDITIVDYLDNGVDFVSAEPGNGTQGTEAGQNIYTWVLADVPANSTGVVKITVRVNSQAGEVIKNNAKVSYGPDDTENPGTENPRVGSKIVQDIDNQSPNSDGTYKDVTVSAGDEITYRIDYVNHTGETAKVSITDKLHEHLEFVSATVGGAPIADSEVYNAGTHTVAWNIANVPAGYYGYVTVTVKVGAGFNDAKVVNSATITYVGENGGDKEEPDVENPFRPNGTTKYVAANSAAGVNSSAVKIGDLITYEIHYQNPYSESVDVEIIDTLGPGLEYIADSHTLPQNGVTFTQNGNVLTWNGGSSKSFNIGANASGTVRVTARVTKDAGSEVVNHVQVSYGKRPTDPSPIIETAETRNPRVSQKEVIDPSTKEIISGQTVAAGDELTYRIYFVNNTGETTHVEIIDELPQGVVYVGYGLSNTTDVVLPEDFEATDFEKGIIGVVFKSRAPGATGYIDITVRVTEAIYASAENGKLVNTAKIKYSNQDIEEPGTENPLGSYKIVASDSLAGVNGEVVYIGDTITYVINYSNPRDEAATLTITDVLQKGLEFLGSDTSHTKDDDVNPGYSTITWEIQDVPANGTGSVRFDVLVTEDVDATEIANQAGIEWDYGSNGTEGETPGTVNPLGSSKYVAKGSGGYRGEGVKVGDEITYVIRYVNDSDAVRDLTITDELASRGLEIIAVDVSGAAPGTTVSYLPSNLEPETAVFDVPAVAARAWGEVKLTVRVTENAPGKIINQAVLEWENEQEPELPPPVVNPVESEKYVASDSAAGVGGAKVYVGDEITYNIRYANSTGEVSALTISDTLAGYLEFVDASDGYTYNAATRTITWRLSSMADGEGGTVWLKVRVAAANTDAEVRNEATLTWAADYANPEKPSVTNPLGASKYVSSETGKNGTPVRVGEKITYTIFYTNPQPGTYNKLVITDELASGLVLQSATGPYTYHEGTNTVTWTFDPLANDVGFVTLTVLVTSDIDLTQDIENEADLTWNDTTTEPVDPPDPNPVGSSKFVQAGSPGEKGAPVRVGDEITYDIFYHNTSDVDSALVIWDDIPAGTEYVGHTSLAGLGIAGSDGYSKGSASTPARVQWLLTNVPAHTSGIVSITLRVTADAGEEIRNEATLRWLADGAPDEEDPGVTNPVGSSKYIDAEGGTAAVVVGSELTYAIRYVNLTGEASKLTITDQLPTGMEYVSSSHGGVFADGKVTWQIGSDADKIQPGQSGTVTVTVLVTPAAITSDKMIENKARLEWDSGPEEPGTKDPIASSKYVQTGSIGEGGATVHVGDVITYEIYYYNNSDEIAALSITDTLANGLEFVSFTDATDHGAFPGNGYDDRTNTVSWNIYGVGAGESGTVSVTARVTAEAGDYVTNQANLLWLGVDSDPENPETTNPVGTSKYIISEAGYGWQTPVRVGDEVVYEIRYLNEDAAAVDLTITDTLAAGLAFVAATDENGNDISGQYDGSGTMTWTIPAVQPGVPGRVTITVRVTPEAVNVPGHEIINEANLSWGDDVEIPSPVGSSKYVADDSVNGKDGAPVHVGDEIIYEIYYINNDAQGRTADKLTISDTLEPGLEFVAAYQNGSEVGSYDAASRTFTHEVTAIGPKASGSIKLVVRVTGEAGDEIYNKANLTWSFPDGDEDEEDPDVTNPVGSTKYVAKGSPGYDESRVQIGDVVTYDIRYFNNSDEPAALVITDQLAADVAFVEASFPGRYEEGSRTVIWDIGTVPAGGRGTVTLQVKVNENAGSTIVNEATLTWDGVPGETPGVETPVGSSKYVPATSGAGYDGAIVKPGDEITYAIRYINNTGKNATLEISDTLPEGVEYVSHTDGPHSSIVTLGSNNRSITWAINTALAPDTTGEVTVTVRVTAAAEDFITNTANLVWRVSGEGVVDEEDPDVTNPVVPNQSTKRLQDGLESVRVGQTVTYEIYYVNNNGEKADLTITDTLDDGVAYVGHTGNGTYDAGSRTLTWVIPEVEDGAVGVVSVTVRVTAAAGSSIYNQAELDWKGLGGETPDIETPVTSSKYVAEGSKGYEGQAVRVGDEITYEIRYVNNNEALADLVITDRLSTGLAFVSASDDGEYDPATNTVTWALSDIPGSGSGKEGTVRLTLRVTAEAGQDIYNQALLKWSFEGGEDEEDPDVTNPVGSSKYVADGSAGYEGAPVRVGEIVEYEIRYVNLTGEQASLTITDTLPEGLEYYDSDPAYDGVSGRTYTWNIGQVGVGASGKVTLWARVTAEAGTVVVNAAELDWGDGEDPETPEVPTPLGSSKYVKAGSKGYEGRTVHVGDEITYEIRYINNTGRVASLEIVDELAVGLEYLAHTGTGGSFDGVNTVHWVIDTVQPGEEGFVTLKVRVTEDAITGGGNDVIYNLANMTWSFEDGTEPDTENPDVTNPVEPGEEEQDLAKKELSYLNGSPARGGELVKVGDQVTYTISYDATDALQDDENDYEELEFVIIKDYLPEGTKLVNATGWISDPAAADYYDYTDFDPATPVEDREPFYLVTEADGSVYALWTINHQGSAPYGGVDITLEIAYVPAGVTTLTNQAEVTFRFDTGTDTEEPGTDNRYKATKVLTDINGEPVDEGVRVRLGDEIAYTIRYYAPEGTETVTITDKLPAGTEYVGAMKNNDGIFLGDGYVVDGEFRLVVPVTESTLAGFVTLTLRVSEIPEDQAVIKNSATITYRDGEGNETDDPENPDTENPYGASKVLVQVDGAEAAPGQAVRRGQQVTYRITYNAPAGTDNVQIVDELPEGTSYVSSYSKEGVALDPRVDGRTYTWNVPVNANTLVGHILLTLKIDEVPEGVTALVNAATVTYTGEYGEGEPDPDPEEPDTENPYEPSSWKELTEINGAAAPAGQRVTIGDKITYTIGYAAFEDTVKVVIKDKLPEGTRFVSATDPAGNELDDTNLAEGVYTWTIGGITDANRTGSVTITLEVEEFAQGKDSITNAASVTYFKEGDGDGDGHTEEPGTENPYGAYKVLSTIDGVEAGPGEEVKLGDEVAYKIYYFAPEDADAVQIKDKLPEGTTFVGATGDGDYGSLDGATNTYTWTFQLNDNNRFGHVTLTVKIDRIPADKDTLYNQANIEYSIPNDDPDKENPDTENPYEPGDSSSSSSSEVESSSSETESSSSSEVESSSSETESSSSSEVESSSSETESSSSSEVESSSSETESSSSSEAPSSSSSSSSSGPTTTSSSSPTTSTGPTTTSSSNPTTSTGPTTTSTSRPSSTTGPTTTTSSGGDSTSEGGGGGTTTSTGGGATTTSTAPTTTSTAPTTTSSSSSSSSSSGSSSSSSQSSSETSTDGGGGDTGSSSSDDGGGTPPPDVSSGGGRGGLGGLFSNGGDLGDNPSREELIDATGSVGVFGNEVPLGSFIISGAWSLISLLLSVLALLSSVVLFVLFFINRKKEAEDEERELDENGQPIDLTSDDDDEQDEESQRYKTRRTRILIAALSGILPMILFLLLENLTSPMALFSRWTPLVFLVFLVHLALVILQMIKFKQEKEEDSGDESPDQPSRA